MSRLREGLFLTATISPLRFEPATSARLVPWSRDTRARRQTRLGLAIRALASMSTRQQEAKGCHVRSFKLRTPSKTAMASSCLIESGAPVLVAVLEVAAMPGLGCVRPRSRGFRYRVPHESNAWQERAQLLSWWELDAIRQHSTAEAPVSTAHGTER